MLGLIAAATMSLLVLPLTGGLRSRALTAAAAWRGRGGG
jgi:hypothetical protein